MTVPAVSPGDAALHAGAGVAVAHGVVHAVGPDATTFLQSLLSADLSEVGDGAGAHTLLLTPQGKLDVDLRALRVGADRWVLLVDGAPGAARLAESLLRFKIRVDVDVRDVSDRIARRVVRGPTAARTVAAALGVTVPAMPHAHIETAGVSVVRADWPNFPGVDLLGDATAIATAEQALLGAGAVAASAEELEVARIEAGIGAPDRELDGTVIPQEAFLERDAISFTKGCFLGQELVCRIDTRGHVNRYLRGVRSDAPLEPGVELLHEGRRAGTVTSTATSPRFGPIGLAYVRREVEPPAAVDRADGGTATVVVLPFV